MPSKILKSEDSVEIKIEDPDTLVGTPGSALDDMLVSLEAKNGPEKSSIQLSQTFVDSLCSELDDLGGADGIPRVQRRVDSQDNIASMITRPKVESDCIPSWRAEYTEDDVNRALAYAELIGWTSDTWADGDIQFLCDHTVSFDELARLRITFTPLHMIIETSYDADALGKVIKTELIVTMSWNLASKSNIT